MVTSGDFDEDMSEWDIEDFGENDEIEDIVSKLDEHDFDGLSKLDFFALGIPTSGEGLSAEEIGSLLSDALDKAGIDWSSGEYKCTELYSKEKLSGDFFN